MIKLRRKGGGNEKKVDAPINGNRIFGVSNAVCFSFRNKGANGDGIIGGWAIRGIS